MRHARSIRYFCIVPIFLGSIIYQYAYSQSEQLLKLPAHTHYKMATWWDSVYRFSNFQVGTITFRTGFSPPGTTKLNYNFYFGQIDMINLQGDTLQVTPSNEIKLIEIGGTVFLYASRIGYVEILEQSPVALGVFNILVTEKVVVDLQDRGAVSTDVRGQMSDYDRYYKKTRTYFFIDKGDKLHKAMKPSILKLFPGHNASIKAYLRKNYIDFNREKDLVQLLNFCNQLEQP